mmetsp:Transcript_3370/g.8700  ORF Transcript_3370/g.8700 Transcript_3370/m.8700 type:complete len:224 (-) Transcript_3370:218-889(-)
MSPTSMPRTKRCSMRRPRATLTLSSHCRGRSSSTAAATSTTPSSGRTSARSPRAAACCRTARSPRPSPPSSARSKPSRPSSTRPPPRSRARAGAGSGTTRPRTRSRSRRALTRTRSRTRTAWCRSSASTSGSTPTTCSTRTCGPSTSSRFGASSTGRMSRRATWPPSRRLSCCVGHPHPRTETRARTLITRRQAPTAVAVLAPRVGPSLPSVPRAMHGGRCAQ